MKKETKTKQRINEDFKHGFLAQVHETLRGNSVRIQNFLARVDQVFNLMQSRLILLGGSSGTGKSSFTDEMIVLAPWRAIKKMSDVHFEVLYFSLERKKAFKHGKWMSWFMYQDHGKQVPSDTLMFGDYRGKKISKALYTLMREYDDEMSELLESVHVYDGRITTSKLAKAIKGKAKELGVFFLADDVGVLKIGKGEDEYVAYFDEDKTRPTKVGPVQYVDLEYKGEKFTLEPNTNRYFLHNLKTFLFIVVDGIGLLQKSKGQTTKTAIDRASDLLSDARDMFGFSPVVVSQFNRGLADVQRSKLHGSDMSPNESDFKDSGNLYQAADVVLGLFDPYRFKAFDENGLYNGYDVRDGMMAPQGFCRFRSLHVLKNTFGFDGKMFGLKFMGEVNSFTTLPRPDELEALEKEYTKISNGY